jgi:hypothetical protein
VEVVGGGGSRFVRRRRKRRSAVGACGIFVDDDIRRGW